MPRSSHLNSRLFQAGCEYEVEVLGRCAAPYTGRMQHTAAVELVKKNQPAKKSQTVASLEHEFKRRGLAVKFYTAVGSALDFHESTDAFLEFNGMVVTIDLTLNPDKEVSGADVVVQPDDLKNLSALAARIGREFITKMQKERR